VAAWKKTVGRCPTPHKLLKKFDQNFIKNRENRAIFGELIFIQDALAHSVKFLPRFFLKRVEFEGSALMYATLTSFVG